MKLTLNVTLTTSSSSLRGTPHPPLPLLSSSSFHAQLPECPGNTGAYSKMFGCSRTVFNKQHNKGICHNASPSAPGRLLPTQWHAHCLFSSSLLIPSNYMWHSLSHNERGPHFGRKMEKIGSGINPVTSNVSLSDREFGPGHL